MILLFSDLLYQLYLGSASLLIVFYGFLLVFAFFYHSIIKTKFPLLYLYFILCFLFELFVLVKNKTSYLGINTKIYDHIYLIIGIVCISIFYFKLHIFKKLNFVVLICAFTLVVVGIYLAIVNNGYLEGPKITPFKNLYFSSLAIMVHTKLIRSSKLKELKNEPLFWFNSGLLIINLFYLILMPLFNYAIDLSDDLAFCIGIFKNFTDPIACILWSIGIYKLKKFGSTPISSL